jgi:RNA recognition motif-containing protein
MDPAKLKIKECRMDIYVGNLSSHVTEIELNELFGRFGEVANINIVKDKYTGEPRGFAFVTMKTNAEAQTAIKELNGSDVSGRKIVVNEARPKKDNNRRGGGPGGSSGRRHPGGGGGGYGRRF